MGIRAARPRLVAEVVQVLRERKPPILTLSRVPDARLHRERGAMRLVGTGTPPPSIGALREALDALPRDGVEPEAFWTLARSLPYVVEIRPTPNHPTYFDVVFRSPDAGSPQVALQRPTAASEPAWNRYANSPRRGMFALRLAPELREYLSKRLPDYMCPSAFVALQSIPLTAHGKLDLRALPAPDDALSTSERQLVAPRDDVEARIARIWAELLGLPEVGVHDHFFNQLGGHSLLGTQLISRLRDVFHVAVPLRRLFESPTVAGLGQAIRDLSTEQEQDGSQRTLRPTPTIARRPAGAPVPLSFGQERIWFLEG